MEKNQAIILVINIILILTFLYIATDKFIDSGITASSIYQGTQYNGYCILIDKQSNTKNELSIDMCCKAIRTCDAKLIEEHYECSNDYYHYIFDKMTFEQCN